uniref:Uncharacterized protein n=1 Tax=Chlamydomonas leiostraca TaxID=1034604 RepID=A0A7S0RZX2_9CHLO
MSTSSSIPMSAYAAAAGTNQFQGLSGMQTAGSQPLPSPGGMLPPPPMGNARGSVTGPSLDTLYRELYSTAAHSQYHGPPGYQLGSEDMDLSGPHVQQPGGGFMRAPDLGAAGAVPAGGPMHPLHENMEASFLGTPSQSLPLAPGLTNTGLTGFSSNRRASQRTTSDLLRMQAITTASSSSALPGASSGGMRHRGQRSSLPNPGQLPGTPSDQLKVLAEMSRQQHDSAASSPLELLQVASQSGALYNASSRAGSSALGRQGSAANSSVGGGPGLGLLMSTRQGSAVLPGGGSAARSLLNSGDLHVGALRTGDALSLTSNQQSLPTGHPIGSLQSMPSASTPGAAPASAATTPQAAPPPQQQQQPGVGGSTQAALTTQLIAQLLASGMDPQALSHLQAALSAVTHSAGLQSQPQLHMETGSHTGSLADPLSTVTAYVGGGRAALSRMQSHSYGAVPDRLMLQPMVGGEVVDGASVAPKLRYSLCEITLLAVGGLVVCINAAVIVYVLLSMRVVLTALDKPGA